MFRHPPAKGAKEGEYKFPKLSADSLKALLEYFYTGWTNVADLSTSAVFELGDAAEQHHIEPLLKSCGVVLWNRVLVEPDQRLRVAQFCHLHNDFEYVKYRAFEVLAKNMGNGGSNLADPSTWGDGDAGFLFAARFYFVHQQSCEAMRRFDLGLGKKTVCEKGGNLEGAWNVATSFD